MTDHVSLRQRIRELTEAQSISDPHELAQTLCVQSTAAERKDWLTEALPSYIATVMRSDRNAALNQVANRPSRRMPSKSAKVAGIRDWWTTFIESRISVGGDWKPVGDLTVEDLMKVVAERREQAARIHTQADRYETLLGLLDSHGVETVAELPSDVVLATGLADAA